MIKVERFNGSQPLEMEMVRKIDFYLTPLLYCLLTTAARLHQLKRHKVSYYKKPSSKAFPLRNVYYKINLIYQGGEILVTGIGCAHAFRPGLISTRIFLQKAVSLPFIWNFGEITFFYLQIKSASHQLKTCPHHFFM